MKRLLSSPPPSTVWLLDDVLAMVARRDRKGGVHAAAAPMPSGAVEIGPVGLQAVHAEPLRSVIQPLHEKVEGSHRAAVVVATGWTRCHLLDVERVPKRRAEMEEVVRWRLKKLLPVLPTELRLAAVVQTLDGGRRQLLCLAGFERGFAGLESVFSGIEVEVGLITPQLLAMAQAVPAAPARLLVQQEKGFLSMLLAQRQVARLVRTKPLPGAGDVRASVEQELHLALGFIRERLGVAEPLRVLPLCADAEVDRLLRDRWGAVEGVEFDDPVVGEGWLDEGVRQVAGDARAALARMVLEGSPE